MDEIKYKVNLKEKYKDLFDKNIYEKILCDIMNQSKIVFSETYTHIEKQSNNESDFLSTSNRQIDAKILFNEEQCAALRKRDNKLEKFIEIIQKQTNEFSTQKIDDNNIMNSILYKEMLKRIKSSKEDEDLLLFLPFVYTLETSLSYTDIFCDTIFNILFDVLKRKNPDLIINKTIYIINSNYENKIVLTNLNKRQKEFIYYPNLIDYFEFILY